MERKNKKTRQVGNGEGSLYFSEKLNKWIYQYYVEGDPVRKTLKQKRKEGVREFKARVTDIKNKINTGSYVAKNDITIYALGKEIIDNKLNRNQISESTYSRNIQTLRHIETSNLKNIKIQKATAQQLQEFIDTKKNYANNTIDKLYQLLNKIFYEALKRDYIIKNPMLNVEKTKSDKKSGKIEALSVEEQKAFLSVLTDDEKYRDIFIIALYTGMRMGEILALKKDDIDLKNKEIHIKRTLTRDKKNKIIIGETTKTYTSTRIIPITPLYENELIHAIDNMNLNINNLLFVHPDGSLIRVSTTNTVFCRLCVNAGLSVKTHIIKRTNKSGKEKIIHSKISNYNQHMLRHTYATRMIEAGVPAEVLQKLLGHKDIKTTINTYTTIFDKFKKEQVNKFVDYIQNIK